MASKKIQGITVEIGGDTTKLGKAIEKTEKQTRSLQGELQYIGKLLKMDPGNIELVTQKQNILTTAISESSEKLKILKEAEAQVVAQFEKGEIGEDQLRSFQREISKTEIELKGFQAELEATTAKIADMTSDTTETASELDKLTSKIKEQDSELAQLKSEYSNLVLEQGETSEEAQELASKISNLNTELNENKTKLNEAKSKADDLTRSLDDMGDEAEESEDGFTIMRGMLADLTSNVIQGAISSIGDLIGSLFELSEATEEYRTMQSKLEGSANTFGYSMEYANDKYQEFYKYLGDDQMSTNAITNLMGLGTTTENVSALAEGAIAVWSAYGDSIPIESLTESINETSQVGKVTGALADALNWAGISEDEFNKKLETMTSTQERADYIAQILNSTYGKSKDTYDELNQSVTEANEAELNLKDTQAKLGEAISPVNSAITNLKSQALEAILPVVENLANAFMNLLTWLQENPVAMDILTGVVITLATSFGLLAGALAIQTIISGVTKAFGLLSATLSANPIGLVVIAITGLVAGFIYLWTKCEWFRNLWIGLWEGIKTAFSVVINAIIGFFTVTIPNVFNGFLTFVGNFIASVGAFFATLPGKIGAVISAIVKFFVDLPNKIGYAIGFVIGTLVSWGAKMLSWVKTNIPKIVSSVINFFKQLPGKIWSAIVGAVDKIASWGSRMKSKATTAISNMITGVINLAKTLPGKIWSAIVGAIDKLGTWGSNMVSKAKTAISNVATAIKDGLKSVPKSMASIGKDIVSGLWNGIKNATSWIKDKVGGFAKSILKGMKDALKIKSPSRVFRDEVGKYIAEGIGVGIEQNEDTPINALKTMSNDMVNTARGINGVTLNRQLETTFRGAVTPGGSVADLVALVSDYMPKLIEASNKSIVLDTGTLVGETINQIDNGLATNYALKARGI